MHSEIIDLFSAYDGSVSHVFVHNYNIIVVTMHSEIIDLFSAYDGSGNKTRIESTTIIIYII